MRIAGFLETSLIDWDGRIASVLFLEGCNFRCPFCQNHELVLGGGERADFPWSTIERHLRARKDWLDGVVITGGEPTIHVDLPPLLEHIKSLGARVKLDTNGSNPEVLARLTERQLVDYVAMDLKTSLNGKYAVASGGRADTDAVARSIRQLRSGEVDCEFRTTLVPGLVTEEEMDALAGTIAGARSLVLQQFVPANALDPAYRALKAYSRDEAERLAERVRPFVRSVKLRGKFD